MDKQHIIDKIKKCLALAASDNPHEAANALRQAQALMRLHQIGADEIALSDVRGAAVKSSSTSLVAWEAALARMIAEAFGCHTMLQTQHMHTVLGKQRVRHYLFVGVHPAANVAQYAFEVLSRQCAKARRLHINGLRKNCKASTKTARGDAFANGFVYGVHQLVRRLADDRPCNDEIINQYLAVHHPNTTELMPKDRTEGKNIRADDYLSGHLESKKANLNRAVGAGKAQRRLS